MIIRKRWPPKAVYEVMYDNEETITEVDNLIVDLKDCSLKLFDGKYLI